MKITINKSNVKVKVITLTYLNAHESIFCYRPLENFVDSIKTEFILQKEFILEKPFIDYITTAPLPQSEHRSDFIIENETVLKILKKMNPLLKIRRILGIEKYEAVVDIQYVIEFNSKEDFYILLDRLQCLIDFETM